MQVSYAILGLQLSTFGMEQDGKGIHSKEHSTHLSSALQRVEQKPVLKRNKYREETEEKGWGRVEKD